MALPAPDRHRRPIRVVVAALLILLGAAATPRAQQEGVGTYGAAFLKIPVGARLMASPDIVAGMRPDASLMFSNPAFLTGLEERQLFLSTANWLDELRFSAASFVTPVGGAGTRFSFGTTFLYSGGIKGFDSSLNVVSEESYYDLGLTAALSQRVGDTGLSVAAGATYVRQHLFPSDGDGVTFSAGASYTIGPNTFHVAANDLGGSIAFEGTRYDIASETVFGYGRVIDTSWGQLLAGVQFATSDAYGDRAELGLDYRLNQLLTLRTGAHNDIEGPDTGAPIYAGFGFHYANLNLEYAYTPRDYFSSTHTFSVVYALRPWSAGTAAAPHTPVADSAPPISDSQIKAQPVPLRPAPEKGYSTYAIVAGTHSWLESAQAEARALELLGIPAKVEARGAVFRVVVGRFRSREQAERKLVEYADDGHRFDIVGEP